MSTPPGIATPYHLYRSTLIDEKWLGLRPSPRAASKGLQSVRWKSWLKDEPEFVIEGQWRQSRALTHDVVRHGFAPIHNLPNNWSGPVNVVENSVPGH